VSYDSCRLYTRGGLVVAEVTPAAFVPGVTDASAHQPSILCALGMNGMTQPSGAVQTHAHTQACIVLHTHESHTRACVRV
jgi:hypothetical protein